jgi:hypothetical protein
MKFILVLMCASLAFLSCKERAKEDTRVPSKVTMSQEDSITNGQRNRKFYTRKPCQ